MAKLYPGTYSPFLNNYDDIRNLYHVLHRTEQITGVPITDDEWQDVKRSARVVYRRPAHDPIGKPLTDAWRTFSDDNGETGIDYRILRDDPNDPWTHEELTEYMHDSEVYYGRGYHDFDCSGDHFTYGWTYKRTPAGIVLLHHWGTDI
jgi:hypothetical protein